MKKKILLVDDDEEVFAFWGKKLEEEGYEVIKSLTGKKALAVLSENKELSLVILDILLIDADVLSLLKKIKVEINPGLPVIIHAAFDYRRDFTAWTSDVYDDYMVKNWNDPFGKELISVVKKLCPL